MSTISKHPRNQAIYTLTQTIAIKIKEAAVALKQSGYEAQDISPEEFSDYMTGETPTDAIIALADVLANPYLMIREVTEISELKKMYVPIAKDTVMSFHPEAYEAHFTAAEQELDYALNREDYAWIKARIGLAEFWLEDDLLPKHLKPICRALMKKFSEVIGSSSCKARRMNGETDAYVSRISHWSLLMMPSAFTGSTFKV